MQQPTRLPNSHQQIIRIYKNQTFPKYPDFDEIEIAKYSREVSSRKFAQILKKEFNSYHSNPSKSSRILVYIGGLTTCEKGAVGTHTRGIVKAFISSRKFTQYFLIGSGLECFDQQEELQKIDLNHLGQPEGHFLNKLNYFSKYALTIYNHIIDIAHRNPSSEIILYHRYALGISNNLIQTLKCKKHTFKLILEYNDITIDQLKFAAKNNQWSAIGQLVRVNPISLKIIEQQEKNCIQYANFVVCVTDKLKTYTDQLSNQTNSIVVENATEKKLIESFKDTDKYALREKLNLDPTKFYLCHVGTLTYWDGLQELISSLPKLSCIHQIQFLIIGDGSCKKELIALVQKLNLSQHVQFFDAIPFQDALKYVYIADVIPLLKTITSYQLSPIKYYESMGLGKFLLTSDTPYINGISNLKLGAKVSLPLNCEEISNTLEDLFQRRSQIDELSNSIKQYAIQHHTWEQRVSLINQALGIHSSAK